MAAKFYKGASIAATNKTSAAHKVPPPQSNSMKGAPGPIKVRQHSSARALFGKGVGPHREGPIGRHTGAARANKQDGRGSTDVSYRATSTAHPGRMERLIGHAKMSTEK